MKKILTFILIIITLSINTCILKADCTKITKEVSNVKSEMKAIDNDKETKVRIEVSNLTENLYVVVMEDYENSSITYHYEDFVDGDLNLDIYKIIKTTNYIIKIYSEDTTCGTESLKTMSYKTPKFNVFYSNSKCQENRKLEMCNAFYDTKSMNANEFSQKLNEEIRKLEESEKSFMDYILKYYLFVLIPIIIIVLIYIVRILILKRGNKNA